MKYSITKRGLLLAGLVMGLGAALLAATGNPGNMALCTACFLRDIAGAIHLHTAPVVQYFRPEIVGILCGAFIMALVSSEYNPTKATAPGTRFIGGMILMINALVFLGCTLRMVIRLSAGDLSALVGLVGFVAGVFTGVAFLNRGYSLGKSEPTTRGDGVVLPGLFAALFVLTLVAPQLFAFSEKGPGSMHANIWLALGVGLVFGALGQVTRLCFAGAVRNVIRLKDFSLLMPVLGFFLVMLVYNIATGSFAFDSFGPIAHNQHLWNILSMYAVGFAGVLLSGCPVRQVINAGSGSGNAIVTVIGMLVGAAFAHNFSLAASASALATETEAAVAGGPGLNGKIAVIASIIILFIIAFRNSGEAKQEI